MSIILKRNQAEKLLAMFSTEISDEEITICNDPVRGLLAWYTELPEEGSFELDSESIAFEAKSLAHVEGLEAAKELEPGTCRVCMRPILKHSESQEQACIGKLRKARETTAELVSRVVKESK